MKIADADILMVAGLGNSSEGHWQHRWQERIINAKWVEQPEWDRPDFETFVGNITQAVMMATRPVVLIGHSLGSAAIVHAASRFADTKVRGAFLVAIPDLDESLAAPKEARGFGDMPRDPLAFPSLLIASSNDPLCSLERAAEFSSCWGSEFHDAGDVGHINVASGHGPWPEGLMMFTRLMGRVKA